MLFLFEYVFSHCLVHIPIVNCLIFEPGGNQEKKSLKKLKKKKKGPQDFMFFNLFFAITTKILIK